MVFVTIDFITINYTYLKITKLCPAVSMASGDGGKNSICDALKLHKFAQHAFQLRRFRNKKF